MILRVKNTKRREGRKIVSSFSLLFSPFFVISNEAVTTVENIRVRNELYNAQLCSHTSLY